MIAADQKGLFLNLRALQDEFLDRVQAISGKPVVLQSDGNFAGHAVIRMATKEHPAHVLLYKPEQQSLLPYLVAFQCELALRTFLAAPQSQFDLIAKPAMKDDVLKLMRHHLRGRNDIADPMIQQLATRFGSGLGFQLRSLPVAMRVDQEIFDNHPPLRDLQRKSIELQLQENMYALSPSVKSIAPDKIVRPNASMNAAFAKFFSDLWDDPTVFAPYIAAGYSKVTQELLEIQQRIANDPDHDRELIEAWAKHLGLDHWFATRQR